mgnify:CR=1 FL=1
MREIKIVKNILTGKNSVRNIPDTLGKNEVVVAAAWQDGEAKTYSLPGFENELKEQAGVSLGNSSEKELGEFLRSNWAFSEIKNAVFPPL